MQKWTRDSGGAASSVWPAGGEDCCRGVRQHSCRFGKFIPAHSSSSPFPSPWVTITGTSPFSSITGPFVPPTTTTVSLLPPGFTVITSLVHDHPSPPPLLLFLVFVPPPPHTLSAGGSRLWRQRSREIACYQGSIFQAHLNCFVLTLCQRGLVKVARAPRRPPWSHL